jgi:hypothetical protein
VTARHQLHLLGLLTSSALRIHFGVQAQLPQLSRSTPPKR